jgi:hypothetical protein
MLICDLKPLAMTEKWVEVSPKDVIWDNIDVSQQPQFLRTLFTLQFRMEPMKPGSGTSLHGSAALALSFSGSLLSHSSEPSAT